MAKFLRRLGPDPRESCAAQDCPDVWELDTGDFAIIGKVPGSDFPSEFPQGASCGPDERVVVLPRAVLLGIKVDIPNKA